MKYLIAAVLAVALSACAFDDGVVRKEVVTETKYIVRVATDQQKQLPPYPDAIDVKTASQLELAEWIKATEARMWTLESIVTNLVKFYETDPTAAEKAKAAPTPAKPASGAK